MDNGPGKVRIIPDYFEASSTSGSCPSTPMSSRSELPNSSSGSRGHLWGRSRIWRSSLSNLLVQRKRQPEPSTDNEKVELTTAEVKSLHSNIVDADQRAAHLKAQLEHLDELLRSARLVGYLDTRSRWAVLPGEPPIEDDDLDDWVPRFVVLHGSCIYFYQQSGDMSPLDSALLSDLVELGPLPSIIQEEDKQTRHAFYLSTRHGLRLECSSVSKIQVDSWLAALRVECNVGSNVTGKDLIKA